MFQRSDTKMIIVEPQRSGHTWPPVSIVVPNWNGKRTLEACLRSLARLTYPNYEVIVVDDASTDGSAKIVNEVFPKARLLLNTRNLGFAATCNRGIDAGKGEYIALFNNDAIADPSWLSELVRVMLCTPDLVIAGGPILFHEPSNVVWSAGARIDALTGTDWHVCQGVMLERLPEIDDIDYVSGCAAVMRKSVVAKIGGLDERFTLYGEEVDWSLTARRAGFRCSVVRSAIAWHMVRPTGRKLDAAKYFFYARGIFRICLKHFPVKYLPTAVLFQLVVLPLVEVAIFRRQPDRLLQRVKAFISVLAEMREILLRRRINSALGKLCLKQRLAECLKTAFAHAKSRRIDY